MNFTCTGSSARRIKTGSTVLSQIYILHRHNSIKSTGLTNIKNYFCYKSVLPISMQKELGSCTRSAPLGFLQALKQRWQAGRTTPETEGAAQVGRWKQCSSSNAQGRATGQWSCSDNPGQVPPDLGTRADLLGPQKAAPARRIMIKPNQKHRHTFLMLAISLVCL